LLEQSIDGAHGVLLSISGGSDLGLFEINEAAQLVAEAAHDEANIIFGAVIDDALGDEVRVTVIAAGFDGGTPRSTSSKPSHRPATTPVGASTNGSTVRDERSSTPPVRRTEHEETRVPEPAMASTNGHGGHIDLDRDRDRDAATRAPRPSRTIVFDDSDELDVPDFLK